MNLFAAAHTPPTSYPGIQDRPTDDRHRPRLTPTSEEVEVSVSLDEATLGTPVSALGLSTRARNALERANAITVRDLLSFPVADIHMMRGVGNQTRQEIIRFVGELREKFPTLEPTVPSETPTDEASGPPSLEAMQHRVVGVRNSKKETDWNIRRCLLGIAAPESQPPSQWPSQTDVADALDTSPTKIYQVVKADRNRWSKDPQITQFRHELCEQIQRLGGVASISELIDLTILLRPAASTLDTIQQQRLASAVARAAVETEDTMAQRRFQLRRVAGKTIVACSQELALFADKLGQVADTLSEADPLASPLRVFQELYEVPQPPQPHGCQPFSNERLLNLAAAMSKNAAVSSRQEVYPRGMAAERALRLGIGVLSGLGASELEKGISAEQIRERIRSRYPEAEPLPDHPALQSMLDKVGFDVRWNPVTTTYHRPEQNILTTSGSSIPKRRSTATSTRHISVTPDVAEARGFEDRLQHAYADGGFLVLTVRPSRMRWAEAELLRQFDLERVSFDELLFDALRDEAQELEVDWSYVEEADGIGPSSQAWNDLLQLTERAGPKIADNLAQRSDHLLLVHPGLIARYDLMSILETLRDKVGHDVPCPGLWVLVAMDGQNDMPILDHAEIPLITPGQRAKVSEGWIDNVHRGRPIEAAASVMATTQGGGSP